MSLLATFQPNNLYAKRIGKNDNTPKDIPMNEHQIRMVLKYIDTSVNKKDKAGIFEKMGHECLYSRNLDQWILSFKDNHDEFFDQVKRGESSYWEKLEYNKETSVITLVGREFQTCACAYGKGDTPPESLCLHCCRKFQEELFSLLLDKKVRVRIDESVILGGKRCSTTIFVG